MKNKTLKDFFENYSTAPELHRKAWKQSCIEWENFRARPSDFANAKDGEKTGFTYFSDTVPFAEENFSLIAEMLLNDFYFNSGYFDNIKKYRYSRIRLYHYLAQLTWDLLAYELIEYLND